MIEAQAIASAAQAARWETHTREREEEVGELGERYKKKGGPTGGSSVANVGATITDSDRGRTTAHNIEIGEGETGAGDDGLEDEHGRSLSTQRSPSTQPGANQSS